MTTYLVIGAARIQQWILRTPELYLTRGASRGLTTLTGRSHVQRLIDTHNHGHPKPRLPLRDVRHGGGAPGETAEIAGVVVLCPTEEAEQELAGGEEAEWASTVEGWLRTAARLISDELPGLEWSCWAHRGPSYVATFDASKQGKAADVSFLQPPSTVAHPLLQSCEGCSRESAVKRHYDPGGEAVLLGPDCLARKDNSGTKPPTEANDFKQLATRGGLAIDEKPDDTQVLVRGKATNHLATIAADGNNVGALFTAAAANGGRELHRELSIALDTATRKACEAARESCRRSDITVQIEPDIVHYLGGDDVLATVGARFAWKWAVALCEHFETEFQNEVERCVIEAGLTGEQMSAIKGAASKVSMGVGLAFANQTHPFSETFDHASKAEGIAKRRGAGKASTISWVDLTAESGPSPTRSITLTDAKDQLRDGHVFAPRNDASGESTLNASARHTLLGALRIDPDEPRPPGLVPGSADERAWADERVRPGIKAWAKRTDNLFVLSSLDSPRDGVQPTEQLRHDVDRMRWWPKW